MIRNANAVLLAVFILAVWLPCQAATITVMRDGSGDYTRIQPALDAAASGDTILIGPGEFFESESFQWPGYSYGVDVYAFIRVPELTIIGAGPEETVIGPREYIGNANFSPKAMVAVEGESLVLRNLALRNCYDGLHADRFPVDIENCYFLDNAIGVTRYLDGEFGGKIKNCNFIVTVTTGFDGIWLLGQGDSFLVEDCDFNKCQMDSDLRGDFFLQDCRIFGGARVGLSVGGSPLTHCFVNGCSISEVLFRGIVVNQGGSLCEVTDSEVLVSVDQESVNIRPYSRFSESIPFLVETIHDHPTSGSCNSFAPFFPVDIQFLHCCRPQSWQVAVAT